MRLSIALSIFFLWLSSLVGGQTAPDLENGFKNYASYHGSDIDTVDLKSGNLMVHIPMPWTYTQRGGAINARNLLTVTSRSGVQVAIAASSPLMARTARQFVSGGSEARRIRKKALAGRGLGFDNTLDLSLQGFAGYQTDPFNNVSYFSRRIPRCDC